MFRYRLEPVLKYRKTLEDEQQRSLAEANRHYLAELGKVKEIESERAHVMEKMKESMKNVSNPALYRLYYSYLAGSVVNIESEKQKADAAKQIVDMERETLIELVKGRRIIELHRERLEKKYKAEEARKERTMLDEIALMGHAYKMRTHESVHND